MNSEKFKTQWHANVCTEEIEELFAGSNFDWTLPASQVAKHSDQGSPRQLEYETQSSTTHQRVAVLISPP